MALAPWIAPALLAMYVHNIGVRLRREFRGHTRHPGDADAIIRACIEACWNGRTFTASPGHFDMFWTRDLSFSVPVARPARAWRAGPRVAGVRAGCLDEAAQPHHDDDPLLRPARRRLRIRRRLAAAVPGRAAGSRRDRPRRAPSRLARGRDRPLLRDASSIRATGLVRSDRKFSAHRDTVVNRSNAYGNTMVALLAKTIEETGWFVLAVRAPFRGRLRPPADASISGSAIDSAMRSATRPSRARPTSGRSIPASSRTSDVIAHGPRAISTPMASATHIRCATRPAAAPSARCG